MTSLDRPARGRVCWGRSASQSTASNASAALIGRKKPLVYRGQWLDYGAGDIDAPVARRRLWTNKDFNYDNVGISLLSLFTAATFEGWPE